MTYKHDFVEDNPYLVYTANPEVSYTEPEETSEADEGGEGGEG